MTESEWLQIGYEKNIIELTEYDEIEFYSAYHMWFLMKKTCIKPQSLDRIEVTYNRYYRDNEFSKKYISKITDADIISFLSPIIFSDGRITLKELQRVMQIVRGVLVYFRDIKKGGVSLHDWDCIKRYLPLDKLVQQNKLEEAIKVPDVENLFYHVVHSKIYPSKQCGCLALCMNFYLGLRIGELASLTFNDFDFERNVVRIYKTESKYYERSEDGSKLGCLVYRVVEDTKTVYSVRTIPLMPEVKVFYNLIKKWQSDHKIESNYICDDGDDVIIVQSLATTLRKLCDLCNVPYFHSHMIRKTFATKLHYNGVPTREISDLLGHSEIATTENSYILTYGKDYSRIYAEMRDALDYEIEKPCNSLHG